MHNIIQRLVYFDGGKVTTLVAISVEALVKNGKWSRFNIKSLMPVLFPGDFFFYLILLQFYFIIVKVQDLEIGSSIFTFNSLCIFRGILHWEMRARASSGDLVRIGNSNEMLNSVVNQDKETEMNHQNKKDNNLVVMHHIFRVEFSAPTALTAWTVQMLPSMHMVFKL